MANWHSAIDAGIVAGLAVILLLALWDRSRTIRIVVILAAVASFGLVAPQSAGALDQTVVPPPSVSTIPGHHVFIESYGECIYLSANPGLGMQTSIGSGHPRMDSFVSIDWWNGSTPCGNTSAEEVAYSFYVEQDLVYYTPYGWLTCNTGPHEWNQYYQHAVFTGYGWPSVPCGADYYYERVDGFDYLGNGAAQYSSPNVYVS